MAAGGKGSAPRPFSDRAQYESNFEDIFRKKKPEDQPEPIKDDDDAAEQPAKPGP